MSATAAPAATSTARPSAPPKPRKKRGHARLHAFLIFIAALWLLPVLYALYTSFRSYQDTADHGYVSISHSLTLANYKNAWTQADLPHYYLNSFIVTVPAIITVLFLASCVAFGVARFSFKFNIALLMLFTAGNLLPQQVIITPLYRLFVQIPLPEVMSDSSSLYDSYWGIILIHISFQLGFCVFVLSNYMKTIPMELTEAAMVDGASRLAPVLADHPAALPAPDGRVGNARVHLDLQRLLLGDRADADGRQETDHVGPGGPARPVLHQQQPDRGGFLGGRAADADRLLRAAEAVHRRPDPGRYEGLDRDLASRPRPKRRGRRAPSVARTGP